MNSVELRDKINSLRNRCKEIVELCKTEVREMTEDEQKEFDANKEEIVELKEELTELKAKLREYEDELPAEEKEDDEPEEKEEEDEEEEKSEDEEEKEDDKEECKKRSNKNITSNKMKLNSIQKRFYEAVKNREYNRDIKLNERAVKVTGDGGVHDAVVPTEFTDILAPLYANSILAKLGVQFRTGLPMGDLQIPIQTKGTVGFLGEIDPSQASGNTFAYKTLRPKRISAYEDVSEQMLRQDVIGVFNAVQNALLAKTEEYINEVFFGDDAATDAKPAGIFYGVTPTEVSAFADVTALEATLEEANVYGELKYALSPSAKAAFRSMPKGVNANAGMVYERGEMDGILSEVSSVVPKDNFIVGKWNQAIFASWGDTILKIDDSIQYQNGMVRIYVTAFVDWAVLRDEAFAFGEVVTE